jgi:hypothetical protein
MWCCPSLYGIIATMPAIRSHDTVESEAYDELEGGERDDEVDDRLAQLVTVD